MHFLREILGRLVKREATKEAIVNCDYRCFQLRCKLCDWEGSSLVEAETLVRNHHEDEGVVTMKSLKVSYLPKNFISFRTTKDVLIASANWSRGSAIFQTPQVPTRLLTMMMMMMIKVDHSLLLELLVADI